MLMQVLSYLELDDIMSFPATADTEYLGSGWFG